jgi:hypothetical protein
MTWTIKERAYLAVGFAAAALAAYGVLQGSLGLFDAPKSTPLAIAVVVFVAVFALMIKAVDDTR